MGLADLEATGSGRLRFALVIEGWPDIWVSDASVTLASWGSLQGRNVRTGLLRRGLRYRERLIPQDAIPDVDGISFTIVPTTSDNYPLQSFSRRGQRIGLLASELSATATTIALTGTTALTASTRYHIGTECFLSDSDASPETGITRGQWSTTAQRHTVSYLESKAYTWIYDYPPTMDGRRVVLYAFDDGDSAINLDNAQVLYRGVVSRPPRLASDGVSWQIGTEHIVSLLKQTMVGHDAEAKIVGIYHHKLCPVAVQLNYNGTNSTTYYYADVAGSPSDLAGEINDMIATAMAEVTATNVVHLSVDFDQAEGAWRCYMRTNSTPPTHFSVFIGSILIGWAGNIRWSRDANSSDEANDLRGSENYYQWFSPTNLWDMPLNSDGNSASTQQALDKVPQNPSPTFPAAALGGPNTWDILSRTDSISNSPLGSALTASPNRLFIDKDLSSLPGGTAVVFEGALVHDEPLLITGSGTTSGLNYIDLEPYRTPRWDLFQGYLGPDTVIRPLISAGGLADSTTLGVSDFIDNIVTQGVLTANDGVSPFITGDDVASWATALSSAIDPRLLIREYVFFKSVPLADVIRAELQMLGYCMYIDSNGKMAIRPLPLFSASDPTTKTITSTITPAGSYGSWTGWAIQDQGLVNTVTYADEYNVIEDEWAREIIVRQPDSLATHKSRGKGDLEIKPYSRSQFGPLEIERVQQIAGRFFSLLSRDYASVTLEVPFTKHSYRVGDIVQLTEPRIPAGDGTVGVTAKRCVIIERRWNYDPEQETHGSLTLWMLLQDASGYAPSAIVTGQVNDSGDTWTITASSANATNILLSHGGDGKVAQHYAVGDAVAVIQIGSASPTTVTGTVASLDADSDTITVDFDATWTPGSDSWVLEFQADAGSATTNMRLYTYVSDANATLASGDPAEDFA